MEEKGGHDWSGRKQKEDSNENNEKTFLKANQSWDQGGRVRCITNINYLPHHIMPLYAG